jgi:uncharacterized protein (TIGR02757 family)
LTINQLNKLVAKFNTTKFIDNDPISIPHQYQVKQDIEISGLVAALFAWGLRKTIINKSNDFLGRMGGSPYEFILNFKPSDLKVFQSFRHRTFSGDDAISLLYFLQRWYQQNSSLEEFFINKKEDVVFHGLAEMSNYFQKLPSTLKRSHRHIASPERNSACKRLNMFLRWMVRSNETGVDFGLWTQIKPADLIIPLDVHVVRSALKLKLIENDKANWKTALALTERLREFDPHDPVKYDFALFNLSIEK